MANNLSDVAKISAKGSFFLFLGKTSSTLIMSIASIIIARLLGPEKFGLYIIALIIPSLLITLSDFGISYALTRFSALFLSEKKGQKILDFIKVGIFFKFLLISFLSLIILVMSDSIATLILNRPGIGFFIRLSLLFFIGGAILETLDAVYIGLDKMEKSSLLMNIQAIAKVLISTVLIILGMGIIGAILGSGLSLLLASIVGIIILKFRVFPILQGNNNKNNSDFFNKIRSMTSYGMPLYLSLLTSTIVIQSQRYILALFVSNTEIGNYSIALNFTYLINMLTFPIAKSLFPAFSKLSKEKESVKHRAFKFSVKYTSFLVIPSSIALAVLSEEVIYVLYGSQFFLAPNYLTIYILSFLWVGLGLFVVDVFFNGQGDTTATLKMHLVSLGISVPMALLFTYFYGVLGLLVSFFISQFLSTLYGYIYAHKKYGVSIDWTSSFKIGFSAIASALLVYVFNIFIIIPNIYAKLVVSGSLFLFSFLLFAPLFGAINRIDVDNLNELTKEFPLIYPIIRSILALESALISERK